MYARSLRRVQRIVIIYALCTLIIIPKSNEAEALESLSTRSTNSTNQQIDANAVDILLKDTMSLLDSLDLKLSKVMNGTANAMMRDNLRSLDSSSTDRQERHPEGYQEFNDPENQDHFVHLDEAYIEEALASELARRGKAEEGLYPASSDQQDTDVYSETLMTDSVQLSKKPRHLNHQQLNLHQNQINQNHQSLATDSTERHIKFALDLMQAMFASQYYSSKNNQIESFLISPFSVQMVLMLMHLGARNQTRRELSNILHLRNLDKTAALPAALASSPADEPETEVGTASPESLKKLKRRHGSQTTGSSSNRNQKLVPKIQSNLPPGTEVSHELFGAAIWNLLKDPGVLKALTSANQLFLQKDILLSSQYEWAVKHYYTADVKKVDFLHQSSEALSATRNHTASGAPTNMTTSTNHGRSSISIQQMINEWVEKQTKGKISNFLTSPISPSTLLMAVNVLYFKGDWQYKFDPADTETDAWFTKTDGKTVKVPMMVNRLPLAYAYNPQMKTSVIELPYKIQRLGMFILLPDEASGVPSTMQMLNSTSFANLIASMRKPIPSTDQANNGINVRIPKFNIDSSSRLSLVLSQQLGLKTLFSPDLADLSGMFATKRNTTESGAPLQAGLDELVHKAVLQVDENGSVAAATSATIIERNGVFNSNYFEADHPFIIFLMDKQTGLVLFSGVYGGPSSSVDETTPSSDSEDAKSNK